MHGGSPREKALSIGDFLIPLCESSVKHRLPSCSFIHSKDTGNDTLHPRGLPSKDFIFCFIACNVVSVWLTESPVVHTRGIVKSQRLESYESLCHSTAGVPMPFGEIVRLHLLVFFPSPLYCELTESL